MICLNDKTLDAMRVIFEEAAAGRRLNAQRLADKMRMSSSYANRLIKRLRLHGLVSNEHSLIKPTCRFLYVRAT